MPLDPSQLHPNAKLEYNGSEGTVIQYDATLTYLANEAGEVKVYVTGHVLEDATVVQSEEQKAQAASEGDKDAQIANLEAELAKLRDPGTRQQTQ